MQQRVLFWLPFLALPSFMHLMGTLEMMYSVPVAFVLSYAMYSFALRYWPIRRVSHKNSFFIGFYLSAVWLLIFTACFSPLFSCKSPGLFLFFLFFWFSPW